MLERGVEPAEVAAMLVKKGWEPGEAEAIAEAEDQRFQDLQRENNMGETHAPRHLARTGSYAFGGVVTLYFFLKLLRLLLRLM